MEKDKKKNLDNDIFAECATTLTTVKGQEKKVGQRLYHFPCQYEESEWPLTIITIRTKRILINFEKPNKNERARYTQRDVIRDSGAKANALLRGY